jgi:hypothetical protein
MTIFIYIFLGMLAALMLAGSVVIVYKAGEKELICKYNYVEDQKQ